jgi:hypothetical protein
MRRLNVFDFMPLTFVIETRESAGELEKFTQVFNIIQDGIEGKIKQP